MKMLNIHKNELKILYIAAVAVFVASTSWSETHKDLMVMSCNIHDSLNGKAEALCNRMVDYWDVDIACFTEWKGNGDDDHLIDIFSNKGYYHKKGQGGSGQYTMLFSKYPISKNKEHRFTKPNGSGEMLYFVHYVKINLGSDYDKLRIFNFRASPSGSVDATNLTDANLKTSNCVHQVGDYIREILADEEGYTENKLVDDKCGNLIITGDFNMGRLTEALNLWPEDVLNLRGEWYDSYEVRDGHATTPGVTYVQSYPMHILSPNSMRPARMNDRAMENSTELLPPASVSELLLIEAALDPDAYGWYLEDEVYDNGALSVHKFYGYQADTDRDHSIWNWSDLSSHDTPWAIIRVHKDD